jgi:hypothetical protein
MSDAFVNAKDQRLTKEKLQEMLPKGTSHRVTDEIIELVHRMEDDTGLPQDYLEESLLSNLHILKGMKVRLKDYVNAIKYCNLKRNLSNERAWSIVFPDRYDRLVQLNKDPSPHVSIYNSSDLVTKVDAEMIVAEHIQYAPVFHEAIRREAQLMRGIDANGEPVSAHVQHLAASTLLERLAPPKETKLDIRIGQSDEAKQATEQMLEEMRKVAERQKQLIERGFNIEDVQRLDLKVTSEEAIDVDAV